MVTNQLQFKKFFIRVLFRVEHIFTIANEANKKQVLNFKQSKIHSPLLKRLYLTFSPYLVVTFVRNAAVKNNLGVLKRSIVLALKYINHSPFGMALKR